MREEDLPIEDVRRFVIIGEEAFDVYLDTLDLSCLPVSPSMSNLFDSSAQ